MPYPVFRPQIFKTILENSEHLKPLLHPVSLSLPVIPSQAFIRMALFILNFLFYYDFYNYSCIFCHYFSLLSSIGLIYMRLWGCSVRLTLFDCLVLSWAVSSSSCDSLESFWTYFYSSLKINICIQMLPKSGLHSQPLSFHL